MLWFHSHDSPPTKAASVADTVAVNPNGIKTLSANGLNTFFINDKPGLVTVEVVCQNVLLTVLLQTVGFYIS